MRLHVFMFIFELIFKYFLEQGALHIFSTVMVPKCWIQGNKGGKEKKTGNH